MKVSIVIPTLNQGRFIRQCLDSIRRQTHRDLEIVIQDAVSTDETEAICREFVAADPRLSYHRELDFGQSDAINRGLARSTGTLWTWICSDDYLDSPRAIEELVAGFEAARDPGVVGVFGTARLVNARGAFLVDYPQARADIGRADFVNDWPLSQPASLLLRSEVERVGGADILLTLGMDLDLYFKLLPDGRRLRFVDTAVVNVRHQPRAKSVRFPLETAQMALAIILRHTGTAGDPARSVHYRKLLSYRPELAPGASYPMLRRLWEATRQIPGPLGPTIVSASYAVRRMMDRLGRLR
jgi:glycosyltransferase involved in cell wall biosynthesis